MSEHIVKSYDEQLELINSNLIIMGGLVESQIKNSIKALEDKDTSFAEEIISDDNKIDELEKDINELAYKIIAMRQPLANDLRTVISALSIANDLERMGDHATNIAKRVADVKVNLPDAPTLEIVRMGEDAQKMIKDVLDAFVQRSDKLAMNAWHYDVNIDDTYIGIYRDLLKIMSDDPDSVAGCSHLLSIAKNIERLGDYAQNIAEDIHFIITGSALEKK
ncbi:MAG: phosphate signaling complex protein PhoU [Alphaproteobacteria bacterium]|nr:phosphate signaling complex protein PhoU [Alphaproteobacteria bacterium]|tara:strand:+ start:5897 stop:6559 length:663 start_codon:yes stop_codon:yes gene_type:complete